MSIYLSDDSLKCDNLHLATVMADIDVETGLAASTIEIELSHQAKWSDHMFPSKTLFSKSERVELEQIRNNLLKLQKKTARIREKYERRAIADGYVPDTCSEEARV